MSARDLLAWLFARRRAYLLLGEAARFSREHPCDGDARALARHRGRQAQQLEQAFIEQLDRLGPPRFAPPWLGDDRRPRGVE